MYRLPRRYAQARKGAPMMIAANTMNPAIAAQVPAMAPKASQKIDNEGERSSDDRFQSAPGTDEAAPRPPAKWLVMNYIAADGGLVKHQIRNIDDMEKVGSDKDMHIVSLIDVGPKPEPFKGKWSGAKTFYVTKDDVKEEINSPVLADHGEHLDMSSPDTLRNFIVDTVRQYPSEHIALIMNDHGGGYTGAMVDETDGYCMSVPDLRKAIEDAENTLGKKVDIIGFDACLMAETEVAYELKDCGKILLASEENEGPWGWHYDSVLGGKVMAEVITQARGRMTRGLTVSPEEFAKIIVQVNRDHCLENPTFSAVRLASMDSLAGVMNGLADALLATEDNTAVGMALGRSESFGGYLTPYCDIHDLHDFCTQLIAETKDEKVKAAAMKVCENIEKSTVMDNEVYEEDHPNSKGISIYFPRHYAGEIDYDYGSLKFAQETKWSDAIKKFATNTQNPPVKVPECWPDTAMTPRKQMAEIGASN